MVGFFVNMLALRTDLSGHPSFAQLVARVTAGAVGAYANAQVPFQKVVQALNVQRTSSYNPIFQVGFGACRRPLATHPPSVSLLCKLKCWTVINVERPREGDSAVQVPLAV
jgi:non-ribosomal peptide synthetase component F